MAFKWLSDFHQEMEKPPDYAEKTLAAYKLGMKAGGSIAGVRIQVDERCCQAAQALPAGAVYHPDEAPRLPLAECPLGRKCRCVYRPVMGYEGEQGGRGAGERRPGVAGGKGAEGEG
ncbi:MAG: hypothetical protein L0332_10510 [Chloroflexi bacterium]|nr:hypothetical protein [Chloroflexota bacterium]MCI0647887.1 hypothetical protein [Chloroflexota bacterium]MCI0727138.1 hypothetical protein [Chloroflexota bacterium]